jgi:hypothetical protein
MTRVVRPDAPSDLEDLGLFVLQQLVDLMNVIVRVLLNLFLGARLGVFADLARVS